MRVNINGIYRDATAEEEAMYAQMQQASPPEQMPQARLAALEEELRAAKILLGLEA